PGQVLGPPLGGGRSGRQRVGSGQVAAAGGGRRPLVVHPVHRDPPPAGAAQDAEHPVLDQVRGHLEDHHRRGGVEPGRPGGQAGRTFRPTPRSSASDGPVTATSSPADITNAQATSSTCPRTNSMSLPWPVARRYAALCP